jgi:phospholipid/cholesterol/gamma-HCH transport system ATP-binding protein
VSIEFIELHKAFGPNKVLDGVTLTVEKGQIVFIIGKSGAGKSVLVKHLVGLVQPDAGRILFEGEDISAYTEKDFFALRKRCAMVFQHSTLFDSMTLLENVALPIRKHKGLSHTDSLAAAREKLALVHMQDMASRYPADIGDGLRKRVAIARALTLDPEYVVFDEPTTGLDPVSAVRVDRLIREMSDETGVTSIVVSHDLRSIFGIADRIVMLYQGRIRLDGTPQDFRDCDDSVVHQFVNGLPEGPMEL